MTSSVLKPITVCLNFYPIIYVQHALCHKFLNFFSSFVIFCLDACIVGLMKNCTIHAFQENGVILPVLVQCLMYTSVQFVSFTQVRVDQWLEDQFHSGRQARDTESGNFQVQGSSTGRACEDTSNELASAFVFREVHSFLICYPLLFFFVF